MVQTFYITLIIFAASVFSGLGKSNRRSRDSNGPVVFPRNQNDSSAPRTNNGFISIPSSYPDDGHPYPKVYKKRNGRPSTNGDDRRNTRVLKALAKQGAKVLEVPPEKLDRDHVPLSYKTRRRQQQQRKSYAFSYKVVDRSTGDDFSHTQVRNAKVTNGEYRVKLPDGRLQVVSYTADEDGYKADVKYSEREEDVGSHGIPYRETTADIQKLRVHHLLPVKSNGDVYENVKQHGSHTVVEGKSFNPTKSPGTHNYYENAIVRPNSGYLIDDLTDNRNVQVPIPLNVQIITTNARDYSVGYIPVEITPAYYVKDTNNRQSSHIAPQIHNNGDHGIVVPSTPSSFVLTDQNGQVIDNIELVTSTAIPFLERTTVGLPLVSHLLYPTAIPQY